MKKKRISAYIVSRSYIDNNSICFCICQLFYCKKEAQKYIERQKARYDKGEYRICRKMIRYK